MPDTFGYIKKRRRTEQRKMTQNGIIWFRLCGFSGLIYNTISFRHQKVQILQKKKKKEKKSPILLCPQPTQPPAASHRYGLTDCYAEKKSL